MILFNLLFYFISSDQTNQTSQLNPEELSILNLLSDTTVEIKNSTETSEVSVSLLAGERYFVNFTQPYGLIMVRKLDDIYLSIRTIDPITHDLNIYESVTNSDSIVGFYFYDQIGLATFFAHRNTRLSFDTVVFPSDCSSKYVSNTINSGLTIHPSDMARNTNYCYFNSAKQPITYIVNYSIGSNVLNFIRNDGTTSVTGTGYNDYTFDSPALIQLETENVLYRNRFVSMRMTSSNDEVPAYKYSSSLSDATGPFYLEGYKKQKSKLSGSTIFGIVIVVMLFVALAGYSLYYIVIIYRRHHTRQQNQQQNHNVENNQDDGDDNNNASTNGGRHVQIADSAQNGPNNPRDESGRYKTPAHVNIDLYTSQFQPTKQSETNTPAFMDGKPSHFDSGFNDTADGNAYPLNEYHPPSKGFLAPTNLYDQSDDQKTYSESEQSTKHSDANSENNSLSKEENSEARENEKEVKKEEQKEKEEEKLQDEEDEVDEIDEVDDN